MRILKKTMAAINKYYNTFITTVITLTILIFAFLTFFPFDVAEFKKINVSDGVQVGGIVEYTNDYCQNLNRGFPREISRFLIPRDQKLVSPVELSGNPTDETINDAGCRLSAPIKLPIDSSVPAGEYKLLVKVKYCILPWRCISVTGESSYFNITKADIATILQEINRELEEINENYPKDNNQSSISNINPVPQVPPAPSAPNVSAPSVVSPLNPPQQQQPPQNPNTIKPVLDITRNTLNDILKIVGI